MFEVLNDSNFVLYAAKFYDNPSCESYEEFENDLNRIRYIKKLLKKYEKDGELKERLILNHLIILYNVFTPSACTRMLCFRLHSQLEYLKPFLVLLNYWPEYIEPYVVASREFSVVGSDINMDINIVNVLRNQ